MLRIVILCGSNYQLYNTTLSPFILDECAKKIIDYYKYGGIEDITVFIGNKEVSWITKEQAGEGFKRMSELLLMACGEYLLHTNN